MSLERFEEAAEIFRALSQKYPGEPRPRGGMLDLPNSRPPSPATTTTPPPKAPARRSPKPGRGSRQRRRQYMQGRMSELDSNYGKALDFYQEAFEVDGTHRRNAFRLAYLSERCGATRWPCRSTRPWPPCCRSTAA
ncbi:MAG: hypothetical protein R3F17_14810 [Planctomycetota bacterium]